MSDEKSEIASFTPSSSSIKVFGRHLIDGHGRILHLRGANVGAASKVPNDTRLPLHNHAQSEYTGRPFPLDEAPEHWQRLRSWGLTFIRINVTWDAIEHAGRGEYDRNYLQYLRALLESMEPYGLVAYVGVHQDVWSRYCGGSGAPGWTLEAAGFDLSEDGDKLIKSGAAFLDGIKGGRLNGERGLWPTGYQKLACASMNTFFWGGSTFAPSLTVQDGSKEVNIQNYLQDAFLAAFEQLIDAVGDLDTVVGFELMNEPHPGFIGLPTLSEWNYNTDLHLGDFPSPLQSMCMGAGHPTPKVPHYKRSFPYPTRINKYVTANPTSKSAWKSGSSCPWENEGVWRWSNDKQKAFVLQDDYFVKGAKGKQKEFYNDFYWPFVKKWEAMVARKCGQKGSGKMKGKKIMRMVEPVPNEFCPDWPEDARPENFVFAPHWYDLNALFKKQFGNFTVNVQSLSRGEFVWRCLYWGKSVKKNYAAQIASIVKAAREKLGDVPIIVGECGVPMDLNNEQAFKTGDWKWQSRMMDALISAMESSMIGFNLWNYNPGNRDDIGDDWNAENFSWYSNHLRNQHLEKKKLQSAKHDLDAGSRLLDVIVRPYAIATSGTPLSHDYDSEISLFTYRYKSPLCIEVNSSEDTAPSTIPDTTRITEIYLPQRIYEEGEVAYQISSGGRMIFDYPNQRAYVWFSDLPAWRDRGKADMVRRVDIWVKGKRRQSDEVGWEKILILILVIIFTLWLMVYATKMQWRQDKIFGITPILGL